MSTKKPISPANDAESKQHEHYYVAADPNSPEYITSRFQLIDKLLFDASQFLSSIDLEALGDEMTLKDYWILKADISRSKDISQNIWDSINTIEQDYKHARDAVML